MSDENEKDARLGGKRPSKLPSKISNANKNATAGRFFNLMILVFIGYGFYTYMQKGGDAGIISEIGNHLEVIDANAVGDPRIDRLQHQQRINVISRVFPNSRPEIRAEILQKGAGLPALCGQTVTYRLVEGFGEQRNTSEWKKLQLGTIAAPQGLTLGLEGMKKGELRKVTIPQELWTGAYPREGQNSQLTQIMLELRDMSPAIPQANMPLRRFLIKGGNTNNLRCGDLAMVDLKIWNAQGELLFTTENSEPVYFYLGEGQVPYAIERGVLGMAPSGLYSLVVAPELWKPLTPDFANVTSAPHFDVQPFPSALLTAREEMVLVDISIPTEIGRSNHLPAMESPASEPIDMNPQPTN